MDLSSLLMLLRRRWRIAVPTFVVFAALVGIFLVQPPLQRANSTLVLLPPGTNSTDASGPSNPYERFGDISVVVDIVRRIVTSDASVRILEAKGLHGEFTVAANVDFTRGPIIDITADASTEKDAIADVGLVAKEVNAQLASLQKAQGTQAPNFIRSQVIVPASETTTIYSSMLRRLLVAVALCVGATIGSAIIADAVGRRGRQRSETTNASAVETA